VQFEQAIQKCTPEVSVLVAAAAQQYSFKLQTILKYDV
jgi:hypothetical protein